MQALTRNESRGSSRSPQEGGRRDVARTAATPPSLDTGTVVRGVDGAVHVQAATGARVARRAASCLVAPQEGDRVLLALEGGQTWVLAVLERLGGGPLPLDLEGGDVRLRVPHGRLEVSAAAGADLVSGGAVEVVAPTLGLTADEARVAVSRVGVFGGFVAAQVERVQVVAGALDGTIERLTQRIKRSLRLVEESDQVRAGSLDYRADGVVQLQGRTAVVTAEQLVKVDGAQIHVG
jgi:hypothetical protein